MHKTLASDGFFEGTYDFIPVLREVASNRRTLLQHMPYIGRWCFDSARPVFGRFPDAVERLLSRFRLPYLQTNQLAQVGLQYWLRGNHDSDELLGVPDGYEVQFSRYGHVCFGEADRSKFLTVEVLRADVAEQLRDIDCDGLPYDDVDRKWQQVARVGNRFGNAVITHSLSTHYYRGLFSGLSGGKRGARTASSRGIAQDVFETVLYW